LSIKFSLSLSLSLRGSRRGGDYWTAEDVSSDGAGVEETQKEVIHYREHLYYSEHMVLELRRRKRN
jgi:hypothetical protein